MKRPLIVILGTSFEERMSQLRQLEIEAEHVRQEVLVHRYANTHVSYPLTYPLTYPLIG